LAKKEQAKELDTLTFDSEKLEQPEKSYVPDGFETIEEYFEDLRENYELDLAADDDNRKAALEDKRFTAGEQWDPRVLEQRAGLPCLSLNTIPQFIAQLAGDWRENKNSVKVLPAENGDKAVADIRADLIRSIWTKNRGDRVLANTFEEMVQCGDGDFRIGVQYSSEDVFDQDIVLLPIADSLSVVWDRLSIDPTGRDATRCFVDDALPTKEYKRTWPDSNLDELSADVRSELDNTGWITRDTVRITEHWRMIERKRLLALFTDGTMEFIDKDNIDDLEQKHGPMTKSRLAPCRYAQMHLVNGCEILAGPYEYRLSRLPIIRMSGRTVSLGGRRVRYGLVRFMKDAVRLRNFWRSQAAEMLGYMPKAQWMATESAVEGKEDIIRQAHKSRDPLLVFNDEAVFGQNVQRVEPPQLQMALLNEAQINSQDMKDITGIHDASLGIKSNETSGRAIMARQREGDVASLTYYDNGNAAILEAGDVINQLIPQIYDGTRIVRTIGEDEATKLVKINDPMDPESPDLSVGKYDVAMTSGASYTTRRVEAAQAMMEAIQVAPEIMQVAGDLVVKAQDWPGAEELAERLRKMVPPQFLSDKERQEMGPQAPDMQAVMQQQAQAQAQMQQTMQELDKLQKENLTLKVKADIEKKKLEIEEYNAETDRLTAYANIIKAGDEMELAHLEQQAKTMLEGGKLDMTQSQHEDKHNLAMDQAATSADQFEQQQETARQVAAVKKPSDSSSSAQTTE
jgi:hypothetical protein